MKVLCLLIGAKMQIPKYTETILRKDLKLLLVNLNKSNEPMRIQNLKDKKFKS